MKKLLFAVIAILSLSACSGTKDLAEARVDMPVAFTPGHTPVTPQDSLSLADLKWWEFYADSTLSSIMRIALENNRDLQKAAAKVRR